MLIGSLYASFRRRFLFYFRRNYVLSSISKRKGNCDDCKITCCELTRPGCPFFKNNKCLIYEKMPKFCKLFPIDHKDVILSGMEGICKYYWVE